MGGAGQSGGPAVEEDPLKIAGDAPVGKGIFPAKEAPGRGRWGGSEGQRWTGVMTIRVNDPGAARPPGLQFYRHTTTPPHPGRRGFVFRRGAGRPIHSAFFLAKARLKW